MCNMSPEPYISPLAQLLLFGMVLFTLLYVYHRLGYWEDEE
ncbi:hypothetical protein [Candidatus Pyrohabitans sp.]